MNRKDLIALGLLLIHVVIVITHIGSLPDTIPIHFSGGGTPDGFGNKNTLWFIAAAAAAIFCLLFYLKGIGPEPRKEETQLSKSENRYVLESMNMSIQLLFLYVTFQAIRVALKQAESLNVVIMSLLLVLIFLPLIIVYIRRKRSKE